MIAQELITVPTTNALHVFTTPDAIDPLLTRVREQIDGFRADVSTLRGRKEVASFAYRIAQTKTAMEAVGKALADEQKEIPKKIDASRKKLRDTLDAWRDEVRQPLTDWEAAEEARVQRHRGGIANLLTEPARDATAAQIASMIEGAEAVRIGPDCEEFEAEYRRAKDDALGMLRSRLHEAKGREAEQAELARLRRESEERAARDRDEQIRREAAERATREAEEAAANEQRRIEAAARAEREAAEQREADLRRQAAEADRRAEEAAANERRRIEAEAAAAADVAHRRRINRTALDALVKAGIEGEAAEKVIRAIVDRQIPNVSISY